jgi:hypothetical protein
MILREVTDKENVDETAEGRHNVAMRLLDAGVPLTLLFDLLSPDGPDSLSILEAERADPLHV